MQDIAPRRTSMHNLKTHTHSTTMLKINFITTTLRMIKLFDKYERDIKTRLIKIWKRFGDFVLRHYLDIPNFNDISLSIFWPFYVPSIYISQ